MDAEQICVLLGAAHSINSSFIMSNDINKDESNDSIRFGHADDQNLSMLRAKSFRIIFTA